MATVYYADDGDYTVRECVRLTGDWEDRVCVRFADHARTVWITDLHPTRAAAVAALIEAANNRIAVGQEAHRALARLKRDPDAPNADGSDLRTFAAAVAAMSPDLAAVDAALAIPVTVVDDAEADLGCPPVPTADDTDDLYRDEGSPVASRLEPAGSANDRVPYHGQQS
jgi:hypothetical protein